MTLVRTSCSEKPDLANPRLLGTGSSARPKTKANEGYVQKFASIGTLPLEQVPTLAAFLTEQIPVAVPVGPGMATTARGTRYSDVLSAT